MEKQDPFSTCQANKSDLLNIRLCDKRTYEHPFSQPKSTELTGQGSLDAVTHAGNHYQSDLILVAVQN